MNIEFHSHEQQDEFIFNLFKDQKEGFFLDISCGHPLIGSNSYALEKYCGWKGFGFDIGDVEADLQWSQHRTNPFIKMDATSANLTDFLISNIPVGKVVDYISLDVDAAGTNLALQSLKRVLDSKIRFKAMTFEHECHIHGPDIRDEASALLETQGYIRLFEDVRLWGGGIVDDAGATFEDWWIDPQYFDSNITTITDTGPYYWEAVAELKKFQKNEYTAKHRCCRAWPDEYDLFWNDGDERTQKDFMSRMTQRIDNEGI